MKFTGKNFQPWPDFELDINGLTIVIGPSNEGKSSIYRALKGVLRNDIDAGHIRNPKDEALELEVEQGGHTIKASRSKKGSVKYVIDGKEYAKLAGGIPDIVKELKFDEIKLGDFTFDPIFAGQNKAQFLIDDESFKPAEINAILGAFGGTEKLEQGKKQANLLKTQKDSEARVLAGQIRDAEDRKARLEVMSASAHQIDDTIHDLEKALRQLEAESHWLERAVYCRQQLIPLHEIVDALILPDTTGLEELRQTIQYLETAAWAASFAKWIAKPLTAIEGVEKPWNEIVALWKQIKGITDAITVLDSETIDLSELKAFHTDINATDLIGLEASIRYLESTVVLRKALKETADELAGIDGQLSAAQTELAAAQAELQRLELEKARIRAEEAARAELSKACPKCGKSLEHQCI